MVGFALCSPRAGRAHFSSSQVLLVSRKIQGTHGTLTNYSLMCVAMEQSQRERHKSAASGLEVTNLCPINALKTQPLEPDSV